MTEPGQDTSKAPGADDESHSKEKIPVLQQILDNPFLLLFLGVVMPTVFYILWGVMEVVSIPIAN